MTALIIIVGLLVVAALFMVFSLDLAWSRIKELEREMRKVSGEAVECYRLLGLERAPQQTWVKKEKA